VAVRGITGEGKKSDKRKKKGRRNFSHPNIGWERHKQLCAAATTANHVNTRRAHNTASPICV
jgi:hypothetical protein